MTVLSRVDCFRSSDAAESQFLLLDAQPCDVVMLAFVALVLFNLFHDADGLLNWFCS